MADDIKLPEPVAHLIERHTFRVSPHGQDAEGRDWLEVVDRPEEGSFGVYTADQLRAAVEAERASRVPLPDEQRRDVLAAAAYVEGADVDASVLSCADAKRIVRVLREIAGEAAHGIPAPKGGSDA